MLCYDDGMTFIGLWQLKTDLSLTSWAKDALIFKSVAQAKTLTTAMYEDRPDKMPLVRTVDWSVFGAPSEPITAQFFEELPYGVDRNEDLRILLVPCENVPLSALERGLVHISHRVEITPRGATRAVRL